jgi:hypothetical protein
MGDLGMKKFLLGLFVMFTFIASVSAASGGSYIYLEGIELKNYETAPYNGVLEVEYKLVPVDANNKTVTWSVSNLKQGVTATFTNGNKTSNGNGKISIQFKNETEEVVTVKLTAKAGNITKTVDVKVENEKATNERETTEAVNKIEKLIEDLPKSIDSKNYDSVGEILEEIKDLIESKEDLEELIDSELLSKYNNMISEYESYEGENNTGTIIIIIVLGLSFLLGLFLIFKKEEN